MRFNQVSVAYLDLNTYPVCAFDHQVGRRFRIVNLFSRGPHIGGYGCNDSTASLIMCLGRLCEECAATCEQTMGMSELRTGLWGSHPTLQSRRTERESGRAGLTEA